MPFRGDGRHLCQRRQLHIDWCRKRSVSLIFAHQSRVLKAGISTAESLPPETPMPATITITPPVIVEAIKTTIRKISILLDRPYMACMRVIMTTCMLVNISKIPQLNNSPPSIALTTTVIHTSVNQRMAPENTGYSEDSIIQMNVQLMCLSCLINKPPENDTHPCMGLE